MSGHKVSPEMRAQSAVVIAGGLTAVHSAEKPAEIAAKALAIADAIFAAVDKPAALVPETPTVEKK